MFQSLIMLAQDNSGDSGGGIISGIVGLGCCFVWVALIVAVIAGAWKTFEKAGKPGWAAIIPIYNIIVMLEIVGRPLWWIVLFFIPFVSVIASVILMIDFAKSYGKDVIFGIVMFFFPFIMIPILGFGDAKYVGPSAQP